LRASIGSAPHFMRLTYALFLSTLPLSVIFVVKMCVREMNRQLTSLNRPQRLDHAFVWATLWSLGMLVMSLGFVLYTYLVARHWPATYNSAVTLDPDVFGVGMITGYCLNAVTLLMILIAKVKATAVINASLDIQLALAVTTCVQGVRNSINHQSAEVAAYVIYVYTFLTVFPVHFSGYKEQRKFVTRVLTSHVLTFIGWYTAVIRAGDIDSPFSVQMTTVGILFLFYNSQTGYHASWLAKGILLVSTVITVTMQYVTMVIEIQRSALPVIDHQLGFGQMFTLVSSGLVLHSLRHSFAETVLTICRTFLDSWVVSRFLWFAIWRPMREALWRIDNA